MEKILISLIMITLNHLIWKNKRKQNKNWMTEYTSVDITHLFKEFSIKPCT